VQHAHRSERHHKAERPLVALFRDWLEAARGLSTPDEPTDEDRLHELVEKIAAEPGLDPLGLFTASRCSPICHGQSRPGSMHRAAPVGLVLGNSLRDIELVPQIEAIPSPVPFAAAAE